MVVATGAGITERVKRLKDSLLETVPRLSCERLRYLLESYRETDGQPPVLRRAKAFDKILNGITIFIDDNPIVGTMTQYRAGVQPYPEFSCKWMAQEKDFSVALGSLEITEEDRKLLQETAAYWEDKCIIGRLDELWSQKYGGTIRRSDIVRLGIWTDVASASIGRICVNYAKVLNKGLGAVIKEAEEELSKLPIGAMESLKKRDFLNAVLISCRAVIRFAQRYSSLAREMAQKEANPDRKKELERIAAVCRWVPEKPARSFYEAVQSFWFTHVSMLIENCGAGFSPGRFTQYMYPFFQKDKDEGAITDEEAIELLEFLFLNFSEIGRFSPREVWERSQGTMFQNLAIGGMTASGEDDTNELAFLVLEAQKRVRMIQPTISVLCHDKLSEQFLFKALDVVRTGIGMPAFFNHDVNIARLLDHGCTLGDARNSCQVGCVESGFSGNGASLRGGFHNMPKYLELALNNGSDPRTGQQIGPKTGESEAFQSYGELHEAVRKQLQYFMALYHESFNASLVLNAEYMPVPFISALVDDCVKRGKDVREGGAVYSMVGGGPVGTVDLADSLAAIKKLVFEEKRITLGKLRDMLKANFEGYEEYQQLLLEAPKYGNDDDYVDKIVKDWYDIFYGEHQKSVDHLGLAMRPLAISVTQHFPFGAVVGALPSGRKAGLPLADASVSPEPGKDKNGPTALIKSATKVLDTVKYGSGQLNMKFHPSALKGREGLRKLLAMIKTYMDLGGYHVQFNVVSMETLRDAQAHPENYRDLIVRVAGFSAYFIHLDRAVQDEIIKRTELSFD